MAVERAQAAQGQIVTLRARFELGGTLFDPFQVRQVEINDDSGTLLATIAAASIVNDGVGRYHVDYSIPTTATVEIHTDTWFATRVFGATEKQFVNHFFVLPVGAGSSLVNYLTTSELKDFLPSDTDLSDIEIDGLGALAQEIVERITGQTFLPVTATRVLDGTGRRVQPLDHRLLDFTMLEVLRDDGVWEDVTPSNPATSVRIMKSRRMIALGNVVSLSQAFHRAVYDLDPLLNRAGGCGLFPAGTQNVRISGNWGRYRVVPEQIKWSVGWLVRFAASCDDAEGLPVSRFSSEAVPGGRSYTLRTILMDAKKDRNTGFSDVDSILMGFPRFSAPVTVL